MYTSFDCLLFDIGIKTSASINTLLSLLSTRKYLGKKRNMRSLRIAFSGPSGVGKDVVATYLTERYGGKWLNFAYPIKLVATLLQTVCDVKPFKDRNLEQWIETYARENYGTTCWIKYLLRALPDDDHIWVSDVRSNDEVKVLRDRDFLIVRMHRSTDEQAAHIPETELFKADGDWWDYEITNNGTKAELYIQLDNLVAELIRPS